MRRRSREIEARPSPLPPAPDRAATPVPGSFQLSLHPATTAFDGGTVLMGGSPLRMLRLSTRARRLVELWDSGEVVGNRRGQQLLARRLLSAGVCTARPTESLHGPGDVTVVIPVHNRPDQLRHLLGHLKGLSCVVVDDASADPELTKAVAREFDAHVIGLPVNVGPAGARNAGMAEVGTPLVAFVDSDCEPAGDWLGPLLGHFDDPLVAAAAPRIVPAVVDPPTWLSQYESVRSSLDRGSARGTVRPLSAIPFVPSAAVVVRRSVAGSALFDPSLRGGEDVDLVWRLCEAGWDVRYEPLARVVHDGPRDLRGWSGRRAFYGSTAGPLARRHPAVTAPLHTSAWTAATWALLALRRPTMATATLGVSVLVLARRLQGLVEHPLAVATTIAAGGTQKSTLPAVSGLTRAWAPGLLGALAFRRTRPAALLAFAAAALNDWAQDPGELGPWRYAAMHVADDVAYGAGVWQGCLRARTARPLLPRIAVRARVWTASSLKSQLAPGERAAPGVG